MKRLCCLLLLLMAGLTPVALAGRSDKRKEPEPERPAIRLSASPRHGYPPLRVTLSAHLTGVDPKDASYCHAGIEWESRSPGGVITSSREEPRCLHPPDRVEIPSAFTRIVTLETGTYSYRAILHRKDGGELASTSVDIKVLPR